PESGSFLHLGELLLDLALSSSEPIVRDCGKCEICLDVCPTGAFVGPYVLDARRCISYLTIENRDSIPRDLRPLIGTRVFGCDECQTACPYNRSMAHNAAESPLVAHEHLSTPLLEEWLQLGSSAHKRLVRGTALSRASRNQLARNAAVALGNLEEESAIGALKKTLESHTDAIVREHAAWALGKIGTKEAADILRDATDDADERVREEIKMSLADIGFGTTDIQKL
ncbi:tRNA epoxyqueuosine(34) reductase QueG, partial [Myxococcota bacterium]|nr:tRNA epoxyqueuosine(34) reductase QueG [Myxococcota bacterium]